MTALPHHGLFSTDDGSIALGTREDHHLLGWSQPEIAAQLGVKAFQLGDALDQLCEELQGR
jgi:hypothetical protein